MKVLFLQHGFGYGGATKSLLIMQQALHNKVEIYTFVKQNKKLNKIISKELSYSKILKEIDVLGVYSYSEGTTSDKDFKTNINYIPNEIIDFINLNQINILHINSSVFSNLLKPIKEKTKCKIVVHIREMLPFGDVNIIDKYIIDQTVKYADKIIAISPNELRFFPRSDKLTVLSNPHDFSTTDLITKNTKDKDRKLVVGMCANFNRIKGHQVFIEAIEILNNQRKYNIEFRIIGYPNNRFSLKGSIKRLFFGSYKNEIDKHILQKKIYNLELIPFTFNVIPELAVLDIYIRPDLSGNPWGRDIIEAMALKKPIIATGTSDFYVKDNETGFLIEPRNAEILATKILNLIENEGLRNKMGENGYKIIKEMSDLNTYSSKLMDIYNTLD